MTSPQRSRPGAFLPDWNYQGDRSLPPLMSNVDTHSHIFQPPKGSLASSPILRSPSMMSTDSAILSASASTTTAAGRKRSHLDYATGTVTPQNRDSNVLRPADDESFGLESPAPFVNTNYRIAGGLDTPSMTRANLDDLDGSDDKDARRNIGYFPQQDIRPATALLVERNGHGRTSSDLTKSPGWGSSVFGLVGDVAKGVWSIGSKAFKGFYAGGGKGYSVAGSNGEQSMWQDVPPPYVTYRISPNTTPIPGQFPIDDYIPDYIPSSPERPTKRSRQTRQNTDPWVLVPSRSNSYEDSPFFATSSTSPRRIAVSSSARRPVARKPKRSSIRTPLNGSPAAAQLARPSSAPRPSLQQSPLAKNLSPVAIEAKRYSAKRRREERETNASMERFNQRLKDMIREGKEALGTKIDIHDPDDDEEDQEVVVGIDDALKMAEQLEDEGIVVDDASQFGGYLPQQDRYGSGGGGIGGGGRRRL